MYEFDTDAARIGSIAAVPTILDVLCTTTGMGFAAVARVTADRWIACGVRDDIGFGLQPGGELDVETTICHEIHEHREPVVIDDVATDTRYCNHATPGRYGFRSYISMPIVLADGSFFGTLCAIDPAPHRLDTPQVVGMFRMFAELIAFHLDARARLEDSEQRLSRARDDSALREQFIAVLGHDLRNPLAGILAGMEMLQKRPLDPRALELVGLATASAQRMRAMIENILDFARGRLGGGIALSRSVDPAIGDALRLVVDELRASHPGRAVLTDFALAEPVDCDSGRVGQLLSNLLGNALAYGAAEAPVRVEASSGGGVFRLSVRNAGAPIPPETLPHLFQPYFRNAARPSQQGLGLGLYIAAAIAQAHGGTLTASSDAAETCFTLAMPSRG